MPHLVLQLQFARAEYPLLVGCFGLKTSVCVRYRHNDVTYTDSTFTDSLDGR
jgi:hypothetical protein